MIVLSAFAASIVAGLVGLNLFATWRLIRSECFERSQKILQALLIWLAPGLCALLVIGVTNRGQDGPSRQYKERMPKETPDLSAIDQGIETGAEAPAASD